MYVHKNKSEKKSEETISLQRHFKSFVHKKSRAGYSPVWWMFCCGWWGNGWGQRYRGSPHDSLGRGTILHTFFKTQAENQFCWGRQYKCVKLVSNSIYETKRRQRRNMVKILLKQHHCFPLPADASNEINLNREHAPNNSVRVPYLLKSCVIFYPYRPETEIRMYCVLNENCKFKFQINLDRHGPRPIRKIFHPPDPPQFSSFSTFTKETYQVTILDA